MKKYDIIGDIHGHADPLRALLAKLGYNEEGGVYRHPERQVVFVGDFIDRGPKIREVLQIVRAMVEGGGALATMGNHEYNAICFHTDDGNGGYLRSHTDGDGKNVKQHRATLDQIALPSPDEWAEWINWFKGLPLFLDLGALRIVHACWDEEQIAFLGGSNRLTDPLLRASAIKRTGEFWAIETLLKGKEINLPKGYKSISKEGFTHRNIRVKWWLKGEGQTYHSLCLPECDTVPKIAVPEIKALERGYAETEPPVIMGHYWLPPAKPDWLAPNVASVDYSVAKEGGMLVAYRWDGEAVLKPEKFVSVVAQETAEVIGDSDYEDQLSGPLCGLSRATRDTILALERAIDDPATPNSLRQDYREALGEIAMGELDLLNPEEMRKYLATKDPKDLLTRAEREAFANRRRNP